MGADNITLRDFFAGMALAGFLSDSSQRRIAAALEEDENFHLIQDPQAKASVINSELADGCFALADAMIAKAAIDPDTNGPGLFRGRAG